MCICTTLSQRTDLFISYGHFSHFGVSPANCAFTRFSGQPSIPGARSRAGWWKKLQRLLLEPRREERCGRNHGHWQELSGTHSHSRTTQADFVVIPAEGDAVRSGVHGCQEVIVSTRSSSPFKKGMEKLAMGSFFAPLRKIESVSATSLASFLRLPKFQVVSEGMSCLWGGKTPQKLAVPCCNVRFVQDRDVRRSQRRSLLAVLGFSELRANQWLRADFVT